MTKIIDIKSGEHYLWGDGCDGWHFVKSDNLSVIKETMPALTKEKLHYHEKAQQFFYILEGEATFDIDGKTYIVEKDKGIFIKPGEKHRIANNKESNLTFLVVSQPKSHGDRINVDEDNFERK